MLSHRKYLCINAPKGAECIINNLADRICAINKTELKTKVERQGRIVRKIVSIRISVVDPVECVSGKAKISFA